MLNNRVFVRLQRVFDPRNDDIGILSALIRILDIRMRFFNIIF